MMKLINWPGIPGRYAHFLLSCLLFGLAPALAQADEARIAHVFTLPQAGKLELTMPAGWQGRLQQPPRGLPPTIILTPADRQSFRILLTPLWTVAPGVTVPSVETIRNMVQNAADKAKPQAAEGRIALRELVGQAGSGYYFTATDKAPKPGEFKYLSQGAMRIGTIALMFTALANDGNEAALSDTLDMLRTAKLAAGNAQ